MGADLTVRQKILVAASVLGEEADVFSVEDLIVRAWQLYPEAFSLRGYHSKHPDSNRVLAKLSGVDGLCGLGWLEHTDQRMYRVTRKGRVVSKQLQALAAGLVAAVNEADEVVEPAAAPHVAAARKEEAAPKPARVRKSEPKKVAEHVPPAVELSAQEVIAINVIAKSDALRKFLRGSPLTFADALAFWGCRKGTVDVIGKADARGAMLRRVYDNHDAAAEGLPPYSVCYGLLNLHRLLRSRFEREVIAAG